MDTLTRRPGDLFTGRQEGIVLPSSSFANPRFNGNVKQFLSLFHRVTTQWSSVITQDEYWAACERDPLVIKTIDMLESGTHQPHPVINLSQCVWNPSHRKLFFDERLWIPDDPKLRSRLTYEAHDTPMAGHHGKATTFERLARRYW